MVSFKGMLEQRALTKEWQKIFHVDMSYINIAFTKFINAIL